MANRNVRPPLKRFEGGGGEGGGIIRWSEFAGERGGKRGGAGEVRAAIADRVERRGGETAEVDHVQRDVDILACVKTFDGERNAPYAKNVGWNGDRRDVTASKRLIDLRGGVGEDGIDDGGIGRTVTVIVREGVEDRW